MSAFGKLCHIP